MTDSFEGGSIDFLDAILYEMYENMSFNLMDSWENYYMGFNPGQASIYETYLRDAVDGFIADAGSDWPWIEPYYYLDAVYGAYDSDVIDRAFSDAMYDPFDMVEELTYRAQEMVFAAEILGIYF